MKSQRGLATVELALLSPFFFLVLFGIVEVARMSFVWGTLDSVTQRTARIAAVCPPNHGLIKHVALFGDSGNMDSAVSIRGFSPENIKLEYLDKSYNSTNGSFPIAFVRASITNFNHELLIPMFNKTLSAPEFETTIPAESLGYEPGSSVRKCFGTAV